MTCSDARDLSPAQTDHVAGATSLEEAATLMSLWSAAIAAAGRADAVRPAAPDGDQAGQAPTGQTGTDRNPDDRRCLPDEPVRHSETGHRPPTDPR